MSPQAQSNIGALKAKTDALVLLARSKFLQFAGYTDFLVVVAFLLNNYFLVLTKHTNEKLASLEPPTPETSLLELTKVFGILLQDGICKLTNGPICAVEAKDCKVFRRVAAADVKMVVVDRLQLLHGMGLITRS